MFTPIYTLEKIVESRLAELRAEAARARSVAPTEPPAQGEPPRPLRWIQVQIFGR
jgi:hypothetical protein